MLVLYDTLRRQITRLIASYAYKHCCHDMMCYAAIGAYSTAVTVTTGISGAIELTYANSTTLATSGTNNGVIEIDVTQQLKLTINPTTANAIQANGK
jgi:hypothetical protein